MIEINFGLHQAGQLSALLSSLLVSLTACYFVWRQALSRKYEPSYLRLGHKQSPNLREIVETQWRENKEQKYLLQLPFRQLHVLPKHYVNDYAWKPENQISSNIDLRERLLGRWTLLGSMTPEAPGDRTHSAIAFIKGDMTKNMASFFVGVYEELDARLERQLGECSDWTSRSAYWFSVNTTLRVFERVFVGPDLCGNEEWNEACVGYSTSAIATAAALMKYPWWTRPLVAPFLSESKSLKKHINALEAFLRPVLKARLKAVEDPDFKRPDDFVQWWVEKVGDKRQDTYALTAALIQLNLAGIQSTGMVLMQALFDLAGRQDYIEPLRAELEDIMASEGGRDLDPKALRHLAKMDSFLKESQRHVAQNILSVYRKATSPLKLKDGDVLPTGSYVCVPSIDPEADPTTLSRDFDGFRWARLREIPGNENKYLSVTTGPDSLEFGHGSHACPGRFFATNVLKATLARILLDYDLRLQAGDDKPVPKYNRIFVLTPDREREVEFRRRNGEAGSIAKR